MIVNLEELGFKYHDTYEEYKGEVELPWYGDNNKVSVVFNLPLGLTKPSPKQLQEFSNLLEDKEAIFKKLQNQLFEYYKRIKADSEPEENYPDVSNEDSLSKYMRFKTVIVKHYDKPLWEFIGLVIDCDWDVDMGVGVKLIQNKVREIDVQDIVII